LASTYTDQVYQGTLTTTEFEIVIPQGSTFIMKGFFISNNSIADRYFTLKIGMDTRLAAEHPVPGKDTTIRDNLHIPITANEAIKIHGEVMDDMDYYIWGVLETSS
jgi:hypothetical protein